jgi:spore germination cell wall hydrolase CwlJ-like protein
MPSDPAVLLAWVMFGEAAVVGSPAMVAVADVVSARMLSPGSPDRLHGVVVDGFNARYSRRDAAGPMAEGGLRRGPPQPGHCHGGV